MVRTLNNWTSEHKPLASNLLIVIEHSSIHNFLQNHYFSQLLISCTDDGKFPQPLKTPQRNIPSV